ncbi:DUF1028 domain-containing protein [Salinisphaera sp. Q1T1-3]|uniref:DUF1028 domain-containing protein n=1 Tax=Salinisphaera sp. Q1T1-3 TaxID=2321229 RepID=UPI000E73A6D2|nr:DUF1028 domain-containing protein [Salinisphaera sp. Q1T1-3]RJS94868.1 DUF1028 domain-containing protein [Salinisphaera sp. Q1T1-3]
MTFSIAARCPQTGQIGTAISSSSICVASRCAFVAPDHGAVLTQNVTNPVLGQIGLAQLRAGARADAVLAEMVRRESYPEWRQLVVLDGRGASAVHSGSETLGIHAGAQGTDVVAAGNMLAEDQVPQAMVDAFAAARGELAERLLAAMAAGLAAGGEMGPVHSAGLQVTTAQVSWPVVDLRVDWHDEPIVALHDLWERYRPQRDDYVGRASRPDVAPGYGVPGDTR